MKIGMHYKHQWVNHSENFVNFVNGAHTQTIEGVWEMRVKRQMKAMRGVMKDVLPELLDEVLWRSWFFPMGASEDMFMSGICQTISQTNF